MSPQWRHSLRNHIFAHAQTPHFFGEKRVGDYLGRNLRVKGEDSGLLLVLNRAAAEKVAGFAVCNAMLIFFEVLVPGRVFLSEDCKRASTPVRGVRTNACAHRTPPHMHNVPAVSVKF